MPYITWVPQLPTTTECGQLCWGRKLGLLRAVCPLNEQGYGIARSARAQEMLTCLSVSSHARLSCRRDVCRQQTHLPAVIGACAVAAPDTVRHEVKALNKQASGRWSDHMLEAAGSLQVVIAPAAADDQQDSRWPALKQPDERKPSAGVRWSHLHSRLLDSLRRQPDLLPQGSRVLVAVSGGQVRMLTRFTFHCQPDHENVNTSVHR